MPSSRIWSRYEPARTIAKIVKGLSPLEMKMMLSEEARTRIFGFAAARYYAFSLQKCISGEQLALASAVVGLEAIDNALSICKSKAATTSPRPEEPLLGDAFAAALDDRVEECLHHWRSRLPPELRDLAPAPGNGVAIQENSALEACLLAEIAKANEGAEH